MKLNTILVGLIILVADAGVWAQNAANQEAPDPIVRHNTEFALDLYRQLAGRSASENVFFSPLSISAAMAMTHAGARGQTAGQIAQAMHFPTDQPDFHLRFGKLTSELGRRRSEGTTLQIANALWLQQDFTFRDSYLDLVGQHFDAALEQVDFKQDSQAVRQRINTWVEEKTSGKITDLIPPGMLTYLTRLVLTNAVYFKGSWAVPFDKQSTAPMPFRLLPCSPGGSPADPQTVTVSMMHQEGRFAYAENDLFQVLQLPYEGQTLSMVIFLPKTASLCDRTENLTASRLEEWIQTLRKKPVDVYFPSFEMDYRVELTRALSQMGMPLAFTPDADLGGMTDTADLHISGVVHKAYVKVNEEGTEAAAATGVTVGVTALPAPPPVFKADQPFLFLIRDDSSGMVLFLGHVMNPEPSN